MAPDESHLLQHWRRAANDLGIDVMGPVDFTLASGTTVRIPVRVRNIGGPKGMLLCSDSALIRGCEDELLEMGYGYSVLSAPLPGGPYLREVFIDVLSDWGWWGPETDAPRWLDRAPS